MDTTAYETEFWHWLLREAFTEFEDLSPNQDILNNRENIFADEEAYDLTIDLAEATCTDSEQNEWGLVDYFEKKTGASEGAAEMRIETEYKRWRDNKEAQEEKQKFKREEKEFRWMKKSGENSHKQITDFDIILNSIIEKYELKIDEWLRSYEVTLRYKKHGKTISKDVTLEPAETHSTKDFSKAVWDRADLRVNNLKNYEMRDFWVFLDTYYQPRTVREFQYYGFIEFEGRNFFLAENVLIKFPEKHGKKLELIAKEDGAFPVGENKYVKPPEDTVYLPRFELGVPKKGQYKKAMKRLLDDETFEDKLEKIEYHFCRMVGGKSKFNQWGKLIVGYIFSYLFFDDIYERFHHVIFLYFYGDAEVGKGELVKRILDFYGISHNDLLDTPKARSVDEELQQKSRIPMWVDELVPQGVPGGPQADIKDQTWNAWFEKKMRRTNMPKGKTWGMERKEVRTMPVFCSNFKPMSDHLLSRCLIMEYTRKKRGSEKHVQWLKNEKESLQLMMLSFMQHYNLLDRNAFIWNMSRIRDRMKSEIKAELKKRSENAILRDRQLAQFSALITVRQWLNKEYRNTITGLARQAQELEEEKEGSTFRDSTQDKIDNKLWNMLDDDLYQFVKGQIIQHAVTAARHDPLSNYIETIGTLIQAKKITEEHFNWTKDGHLKIWAKAVWDIYLNAKKGTDEIVRRETVEKKLKEMSELKDDGTLKVVNWAMNEDVQVGKKYIRNKGFYIKHAYTNELFKNSFKFEQYCPAPSQVKPADELDESNVPAMGAAPAEVDTEPNNDETGQMDIADELPF